MNELLERMVKDSGFKVFGEKIVAADENSSGLATESVKRLIEIVRRDEREACAKLCDELPAPIGTTNFSVYEVATMDCGDAIRKRSNANITGTL